MEIGQDAEEPVVELKWPLRNKTLLHQLDVKFVLSEEATVEICAYCNCGVVFAQSQIVYAEDAIAAYDKHMEELTPKAKLSSCAP